ncbi:hypothetical protein WDV76_12725 [Xenorhabdus griffiniae]|uniref:hypothetical protein n=1 Tax=Xenorhabdus griffiniae TaxID=351672 RepID=UPI0023593BD1|nr:hypothetical protein [Xenorhabdus griffiniae]MDC9604622.1 hypothetical protein [Xenorhabdus griffiniae]
MSSEVTMLVNVNKKKQELPFVVISPADKRNLDMIDLLSNRNLLSNGNSIFKLEQVKE